MEGVAIFNSKFRRWSAYTAFISGNAPDGSRIAPSALALAGQRMMACSSPSSSGRYCSAPSETARHRFTRTVAAHAGRRPDRAVQLVTVAASQDDLPALARFACFAQLRHLRGFQSERV